MQVRVFWSEQGRWYQGKVVEYDAKSSKHVVNYQDGTKQHKICLKKWPVLWPDIPELSGNCSRKAKGQVNGPQGRKAEVQIKCARFEPHVMGCEFLLRPGRLAEMCLNIN